MFPHLSVQDNLALAILATQKSGFGFWREASTDCARFSQADAMAERIGLADHRMRAAGALSHGAQRQLEVGLVLCTNPKLMLLDEPMAGMGPDESQRMVELLKSLRGNTTIVLVEHDMDAVFRLADTISVLVSGRVVASGNAEQIKNDVVVQHAYLGDA